MSGEKTEQATPQRMKKVRQEGQLEKSQDTSAWLGLAAAAVTLPMVITRGQGAAVDQMGVVANIAANPSSEAAVTALGDGLQSVLMTVAPLLAVTVLVAIAAPAAQGGVRFRKFKVKVQQLNLAKGLKQLFSKRTLWQGVKVLLKSAVIAGVLYMVIQGIAPVLLGSSELLLPSLIGIAADGASRLMTWGIAAGVALAFVDVVVVMRRNRKKTRMTKQEVKEENKRSEGDPLLKGAIRSKQMAMSRNRMMSAVADADVVLVNPTHVAVALRYEPGSGAPKVVAKGAGAVAARIRAKASESNVPMIEDIPLARAIHGACEIGTEVPPYLYNAVARVLAFVMVLRKRGASAGHHRMPAGMTEFVVPEKKRRATATAPAVKTTAKARS